MAFNVIPPRRGVAVAARAAVLVLVRLGWRVSSALFDRERLVTGAT